MPIIHRIATVPNGSSTVGLEVDGLVLRITPGTLSFRDKTFQVAEPFEHPVGVVPSNTVRTSVYLVERVADGGLELVVDEVPGGARAFAFPGSPYRPLVALVQTAKVPAGVTTLADVVVVLTQITSPEAP